MSYAHRITPDSKVKLSDFDPGHSGGLTEEEANIKLGKYREKLSELQQLLYAAKQNSLLIVLQGRDTSGKDGSIRHISSYMGVLSTSVTAFKAPSELELAHDFLWRVHQHTPAKGNTSIFNRSHYEDIVAVRVHDLVPEKVWKKRYRQINQFEELLAESGTIIVKFYLHISKSEQEERLLAREQDPEKAWKLSVGDWKERELWPETTKAYEDVLERCSMENAPWYVVPANHKWYRDIAIAQALRDTLEPYAKNWRSSLKKLGERQKHEIAEYRQQNNIS